MSNYSRTITLDQVAGLKRIGIGLVIVQAITGLDGVSYTRSQLTSLTAGGLRVAGYVWCFPNETAASVTSRLRMFDGFPIESLWLDVEQSGTTVKDVNLALSLCDTYIGKKAGIYSGRWFFDNQGWSRRSYWSDRPLWDSNYDNSADPDSNFHPYGGWTQCEIKQYAGTSTVVGIPNVDLDVAR